MNVKKETAEIEKRLCSISKEIESVITDYMENYAEYGWDNFTETLANVSAQIYMQGIVLKNAHVPRLENNPFR